eukprot:6211982-Pleurochrysis_carterae.AAC.6
MRARVARVRNLLARILEYRLLGRWASSSVKYEKYKSVEPRNLYTNLYSAAQRARGSPSLLARAAPITSAGFCDLSREVCTSAAART